jgi:hypothetical protein
MVMRKKEGALPQREKRNANEIRPAQHTVAM